MSLFNRVGGQSPHTKGLQITVTCPDATQTNPVRKGDPLRFLFDGSFTPYIVTRDMPMSLIHCEALHAVYDPKTPLGVQVFGFNRIEKFYYILDEHGADLQVGETVVSDGTGKVKINVAGGEPFINGNVVMKVDRVNKICEVLIR